jgi:hypothetical protein
MPQLTNDLIKPSVLEHYRQLCAAYGTTPTVAQIEEIKLVAGTHKNDYVAKNFEYALLYFLQKTAVIFEEDTLLLGWIHQPIGTKQEIWYKLHDANVGMHSNRLSLQRGAPRGSERKIQETQPICDEWHPSLTAICTSSIWGNRLMRFAYFASAVKMLRADATRASIQDLAKVRPKRSTISRTRVASGNQSQNITTTRPNLAQEHKAVDRRLEKDMSPRQDDKLRKPEDTSVESIPKTRLRSKDTLERQEFAQEIYDNDLGRDRKRARRTVVVDLAESGIEEDIKSGPDIVSGPVNREEVDMPAEQELRTMLQSKKVSEIKDMLAGRSGQLPDWIENIVKQEMEKKMARDLAMLKNFF